MYSFVMNSLPQCFGLSPVRSLVVYLIVLLLFFYTILSVGTLFGTLARHGMYKLRTYIEWEKEEDGADN